MKRPLALIGITYFAVQLAAAYLPWAVLLPLTAFLLLAAGVLAWRVPNWRVALLLLVIAVMASLGVRTVQMAHRVEPVFALAGREMPVTALVLETQNAAYTDGYVQAVLRITQTPEGEPCDFLVSIASVPQTRVGEVLRFQAQFAAVAQNRYTLKSYADGIYITAAGVEEVEYLGTHHTLQTAALTLRNTLGDVLREMMPNEHGAIAAAMSVGDTSALDGGIRAVFRSAGISHLLVVSGLHFAVISGAYYALVRRVRRRRLVGLLGIAVSLMVMVLAGMTVSILRAGVTTIVVYAARLFKRKSDSVTSLSFAALLLCMADPYAAVDAGFQLSFSATLGVLCASWWVHNERPRFLIERENPALTSRVNTLLLLVLIPAATTIATLPVQIALGYGVPLFGILCNMITVPLMSVVVIAGIVAACTGLVPLLTPIAQLAGLACGLCVQFIYTIARTVDAMPWATLHLSGAVTACVLVSVLALLFAGRRLELRPRANLCCAALFVLLSASSYLLPDANVTRVALVGSGVSPSLVVTWQTHTAVIFRGPQSTVRAVRDYLADNNRAEVDLVVDMRVGGNGEELAKRLYAKTYIEADALVTRTAAQPFGDVRIAVLRRGNARFACVDIGGYTVGLSVGAGDFSGCPACSVYVAGESQPQNLDAACIVTAQNMPAWIINTPPQDIPVYRGENTPCLAVRAETSVQWRDINAVEGAPAGSAVA